MQMRGLHVHVQGNQIQNTCITSQIENRAISVNFQQKPLKLGRLIILQVHATNLRPDFNTIFTHL